MRNKLKILILATLLFSVSERCLAAEKGSFEYKLLESVPLIGKAGDVVKFPEYISGLYKFAFVAIAISALLMLTIGGFYYLSSAGNQSTASTAKKIIQDAILGLVVALVSWVILNTIDPAILSGELDTSVMRVELNQGEDDEAADDVEGAAVCGTGSRGSFCRCTNGATSQNCRSYTENGIRVQSWDCVLPDGSGTESCTVRN